MTKLKIKAIDHIVLRTDKLPEMLHFYCSVLNCHIERELPEFGLTQLRAGNALIDIIKVTSELGRQGGGCLKTDRHNMDHFCLQLYDITEDELTEHLKIHQISPVAFAPRYGATGFGLSIYIHDPQGNTVELKPTNLHK